MTTTHNPFIPPTRAKKLAHVAIVLDRSGSMESCRDATIGGVNEYEQHIRRTAWEEGLDTRVTLTVFNDHIRMPLFQAPLERLHALSRETYVPDGTTRLLDAVGRTIDRLERRGEKIGETTVLVCVVSDGYENASREYSQAHVASRIERLTATDRWTFTYLGSNQDLSRVSADLRIPAGNMAAYDATPAGTADAWERQARATRRRMQEIGRGERASREFYAEEPEAAGARDDDRRAGQTHVE